MNSKMKEPYLFNLKDFHEFSWVVTKIALQLESFYIEESLHDTKLYGDACHRSLTKDEVLLYVDAILKKNKEFYRTEEGKKWLNSDD